MNVIPVLNPIQLVAECGGRLVTTSRHLAKVFGKRHDNVLRDIDRLECGEDFAKLNFEVCWENNRLQNGKRIRFVRMTKDGFLLLAMGFTGAKAMAFKVAYINAFNAMAEFIRAGALSRWNEYNAAWLEYRHDKDAASQCGRRLRRWRDQRPEHERRLERLHPQLPLLLH